MTLKELARNFKKITGYDDRGAGAAYRLYNEALDQIDGQNYREARQSLKAAIKYYPAFDDAYMLLGLTHFACGSRIDALKTINQISDPRKHNTAMKYYDALSGGDAPQDVFGGRDNAGRKPSADLRGQTGEGVFEVSDMEARIVPGGGFQYVETGASAEDRTGGGGPREGYPARDGAQGGKRGVLYEDGPRDVPAEEVSRGVPDEDGSQGEDGIYGKEGTPEPEEFVVSGEGPARRESSRMTDFERRFKKAREFAGEALGGAPVNSRTPEKPRVPESPRTPEKPRVPERSQVPEDPAVHGDPQTPEKPRVPENSRTPEKPRVPESPRTPEKLRTPVDPRAQDTSRTAGRPDTAPPDEPREAEKTEKPRKEQDGGAAAGKTPSGGKKTPAQKRRSRDLVMTLVIITCVLIIAGLGAFSASRHLARVKQIEGIAATPSPGGTDAPADSEAPQKTPETSERPVESATQTQDTPEPTVEITPEPSAQPSEVLAAARKHYDDKNYYDCCVLLSDVSPEGLAPEEAAEASRLKNSSLELFTKEYYNLMYSYVSKEDWENVLKYALPIIKYDPGYVNGGAVYFHAGKACELTGDTDNARKYYQETMARFPGTPYEEYARYRLSHM